MLKISTLIDRIRVLHRDDRGQTGIMVLFTFLIVFMLFAFALDTGLWFFDHRRAQNQVDAAALAAVQELPDLDTTNALAKAQAWLTYNNVPYTLINAANCTEVTPGTARIVFSNLQSDGYYSVRVCVRRPSLVLFGFASGVTDAVVSAGGKATVVKENSKYAIMAMDPDDCSSLWATGNGAGAVVTGGGGTYTGSSCCPDALRTSGGGIINTGLNDVVGCGDGAGISPNPNEGAGILPDPFATLDPPPISGGCVDNLLPNNINSGVWLLLPGRYCKELRVTSDAKVTLTPGVYILHRGLTVNGNLGSSFTSDLNANGTLEDNERVLLYGTCPTHPCDGTAPGTISLAGQGNLKMRGRIEYDNMLIWVDRTGPGVVSLAGGSVGQLEGRLYALLSDVDLTGNSAGTLILNMSLVAATFKFAGQGLVSIPYNPLLAPPLYYYGLDE